MKTRSVTPSAGGALTRQDRHRLAADAYDRFATLVEGLSADDWSRPTDCEAWTVRELVGHMVGAMRSAASQREFLSQYREIRARHKVEGGNQTDVMTAVQVRRASPLSTAELTEECRSLVVPAARGRYRTPAPLRKLVRFPVDLGPHVETWTLGYLVDVILTRDAWMHSIDLARAIGVDLDLDTRLDRLVVADVVDEWTRRHGRAYDVFLSGPAGGQFAGGEGTPEILRMDAVEFCRFLSGRERGSGLLATVVPF